MNGYVRPPIYVVARVLDAEPLRKTLRFEFPPDQPPESMIGVARYLADGWLIVDVRKDPAGAALEVDIIKPAPGTEGAPA